METNYIALTNMVTGDVFMGIAVKSSDSNYLMNAFMSALAIGATLSVTYMVFVKVKQGLNATSD